MNTPACPYCGEAAVLVDRGVVDSDYPIGHAWACFPCNAWIGCHHNSPTYKPLGRLAKPALHLAKKHAISSFNTLWKTWSVERQEAYGWLAEKLGIETSDCDFGRFDLPTCLQAKDICHKYTPFKKG